MAGFGKVVHGTVRLGWVRRGMGSERSWSKGKTLGFQLRDESSILSDRFKVVKGLYLCMAGTLTPGLPLTTLIRRYGLMVMTSLWYSDDASSILAICSRVTMKSNT